MNSDLINTLTVYIHKVRQLRGCEFAVILSAHQAIANKIDATHCECLPTF